jgi:hypothetical protein
MAYVSVEHEPGVWVDAHIEKQWKREGRWHLGCYYFVDTLQFYRVFDADQVRPVISIDPQDDEHYQVASAAGLDSRVQVGEDDPQVVGRL